MSGFSISKLFESFGKKDDKNESKSLSTNVVSNDQLTTDVLNDIKTNTELESIPELDSTLVAVITASVAMMMSSESAKSAPYPGFRVRNIRRLY